MRPRAVHLVTALLAWATIAACGEPAPVARLSTPPSPVLGFPAWTNLSLTFEPLVAADALGPEPYVFVHLTDPETGEIVQTFDRRLDTGAWAPGQTSTQELQLFQSALAPPLDAGHYPLFVGLYDGGSSKFPLETSPETVQDGPFRYLLTTLRVEPPGATPVAEWSTEWLPTRHTGDRQVNVVRLLDGTGRVRLRTVVPPVELLLELEIPEAARDETDRPAVTIASSCAEQPASMEGIGVHRLTIELGRTGSVTEGCALDFEPSYRPADAPQSEAKLPVLRILAWRAE